MKGANKDGGGTAMLGLMQDWQLTLDKILDYAAVNAGDREIVTRSVEGPVVRTTYADLHRRAKQVSHALHEFGVRPGDRVGTLAWNTARHLEIWYGVMGIGAVCHTLNPRLHPDQICWLIRHAEDRVIFTDLTFAPILLANAAHLPNLKQLVILTDEAHRPEGAPAEVLTYEPLIAGRPTDCAWGRFDEQTAAGLCYTSGTTGDPKGVLYSHRSNFLHTLFTLQRDVIGLSTQDTVLMVVPMFHANAWGLAFSCPAAGAKLVMPGARMDGAAMQELINAEEINFAAAVPTVWQMLLQHLDDTGGRIDSLKRVVIGGAACPPALITAYHDRYGVEVVHAWGMTETSPLGTVGSLTPKVAGLPFDQQMPVRMKQGRAPLGVELALTDDAGRSQPRDGATPGHLKVRGPTIAKAYFRGEGTLLDDDGFFDTGDIATIDADGYMQITDRAKDLIKSGGEWISSIELENLVVAHPKVAAAAVIGVHHPKWSERPLLIVKLKAGHVATCEELMGFLDGKIARWWMPDDMVVVDDIPLGPTGKIDKKRLRARFVDYRLPTLKPAA
jgi:fatty-acyl-CoA synthase